MIFRELLSGINGGKVLDIGCGSGQFIEILLQYHILYVTEYLPDEPVPADPAMIETDIARMTGWLVEISGHKEREGYEKRIKILQEHIRKNGISRPPQILALGKKKY